MTGFARVRKLATNAEIVFSLKSVNHRGLDLHFHLPPAFDALENDIRGVIKAGVARGHLQIHLAVSRTDGGFEGLNRPLLALYMKAFREAAELYQIAGQQPDLNSALRIPGMLETGAEEGELDQDLATAILETARRNRRRAEYRPRTGRRGNGRRNAPALRRYLPTGDPHGRDPRRRRSGVSETPAREIGRSAARRQYRPAASGPGSGHPGRPQRYFRRTGAPAHPRRPNGRNPLRPTEKSASASISCCRK